MVWLGFLWVVADGGIVLPAVARGHGGVPVGHGIRWNSVMDHLLGDHSAVLEKVILRHHSASRGERLVATVYRPQS